MAKKQESTELTRTEAISQALIMGATFAAPSGNGLIIPETYTPEQSAAVELYLAAVTSMTKWQRLDWVYDRRRRIHFAVDAAFPDMDQRQSRVAKARAWDEELSRILDLWGNEWTADYTNQLLSVVEKWPLLYRVPGASFDMHRIIPSRLNGEEWGATERMEWLQTYMDENDNTSTAKLQGALAEFKSNEGDTSRPTPGESTNPHENNFTPDHEQIGLTDDLRRLLPGADERHVTVEVNGVIITLEAVMYMEDAYLMYSIEGTVDDA